MGNEEANEIALLALRQVGCDLPEDCSSIESFSTDILVRTASQCLHVMGNADMPEYGKAVLPADMASKFRVCTELADAVRSKGYREEIGFHQFLYPAEKSSRDLVAFLLDRLPQAIRGDQAVGGGGGGDKARTLRNIAAALAASNGRLHVPAVCRPRTLEVALVKQSAWTYPSVPLRTVPLLAPQSTDEDSCGSNYSDSSEMALASDQVWGPHGLAPSIFEANLLAVSRAKEVDLDASAEDAEKHKAAFDKSVKDALRAASSKSKGKARDSLVTLLEEWAGAKAGSHSSRFARAAVFGQDKEDALLALDSEMNREERMRAAEQERQERLAREEAERQEILTSMQAELNTMLDLAEALGGEFNLKVLGLRQVEADIAEETDKTEELIQVFKRKKKTLSLLANRDDNIVQLRAVSAETAKRLLELASEWERVRAPLIDDLRSKKEALLRRKDGMKWKIGKIKAMRHEAVVLAESLRAKDDLVKSLLAEYETLPKSALRNAYTRRLQELAKNMSKQERDIRAILSDMRNMQADVATAWDTMKRSYGAVDEMIFRDAHDKGDPTCKKMYKQLVSIHECFAALASTLDATGSLHNESRELERRIEQEEARANVLNMQQVMSTCSTTCSCPTCVPSCSMSLAHARSTRAQHATGHQGPRGDQGRQLCTRTARIDRAALLRQAIHTSSAGEQVAQAVCGLCLMQQTG
jgi:hypothetical protein